MTVQDTVDTLAANDMLRFNEKSATYEIQLSKNKLPKSQRGPTAKMELLTWAPYKITTANGGDTGEIVNIPREAAAMAAATHTITLPAQGRGRRRKSSSGSQDTGKRRSRKRKLEEWFFMCIHCILLPLLFYPVHAYLTPSHSINTHTCHPSMYSRNMV